VLAAPGEIRTEIVLSEAQRTDFAARAAIAGSIAAEMASAVTAAEEPAALAGA